METRSRSSSRYLVWPAKQARQQGMGFPINFFFGKPLKNKKKYMFSREWKVFRHAEFKMLFIFFLNSKFY